MSEPGWRGLWNSCVNVGMMVEEKKKCMYGRRHMVTSTGELIASYPGS